VQVVARLLPPPEQPELHIPSRRTVRDAKRRQDHIAPPSLFNRPQARLRVGGEAALRSVAVETSRVAADRLSTYGQGPVEQAANADTA